MVQVCHLLRSNSGLYAEAQELAQVGSPDEFMAWLLGSYVLLLRKIHQMEVIDALNLYEQLILEKLAAVVEGFDDLLAEFAGMDADQGAVAGLLASKVKSDDAVEQLSALRRHFEKDLPPVHQDVWQC